MIAFYTRLAFTIVILLQFSTFVCAAPLDDYYLQQFGEVKSAQLQKAVPSVTTVTQTPLKCGMPLKKSLLRDWDLLEQTTQKVLAKQLAAPVLVGEATFDSTPGHFKVHYATSGTDAPPLTDSNSNGTPDWVETVAATLENVYSSYSSLGYQPAPTTPGTAYSIYLRDLAPLNYYGVTTSGVAAASATYPYAVTSWMELDNNYTDDIYHPTTYTPLQSLQITAAHEYHHAIQFGYNYYFDVWYAEATSTWMEDELYDGVNQLYSYIPPWFSNSILKLDLDPQHEDTDDSDPKGAGYGRWIFNRYLVEKHGASSLVLKVWQKLAVLDPATSPVNSWGEIKMTWVLDSLLSTTYNSTLATDFFGFTKRVYKRDEWTNHPYDVTRIHVYSPVTTYSAYPVSVTSNPVPAVTLPHYSFAFYRFLPSSSSPDTLTITLVGTSGIKATAFIKSSGGIITEYPFATVNGTTVTIPGFNSSSEVALLVANTTDTDNHQASFSTNYTLTGVTEPPPTITSISGSSSGGGCFIATAAYGSYLHPQVQLLRDFRDNYLLTNAPGRAFVALYYRYSPPLADFISRHTVLRSMTRLALTPLVVSVAHPLLSAVFLFLFMATMLVSLLRRIKAAHSTAHTYIIHDTPSLI